MQVNQVNNGNMNFKSLRISVKNKGSVFPGFVTSIEENIKRRFLKNGKEIGTHIFDKYDVHIEKQGNKYNITTDLNAKKKAALYERYDSFCRAKGEQFDKFAKRVIKTLEKNIKKEKKSSAGELYL